MSKIINRDKQCGATCAMPASQHGKALKQTGGLGSAFLPWGYKMDRENKLIIPDRAKIATVRQIFKSYVKGKSAREIAHALNTKRSSHRSPRP